MNHNIPGHCYCSSHGLNNVIKPLIHPSRYSSIGSNGGQIIDQDNWTALNFTSATACGENPSQNYSSIITLRCDLTQSLIYHDTILCKHFFDLFTPLACGLVDPPCVTVDPNTKVEYDLTSLSTDSYNVTGKLGQFYQFGICKSPSFCPDGCGACSSLHSSMGVMNSELRMGEAGYPYLIYPNGPACKDLKNQSTHYFTKIQFTCAATPEEQNKATLVEETNCRLIIDFATDKVCNKAISCADDGFDLSPLIRSNANYVADVAGDVLKADKDVKVSFRESVDKQNINSLLIPYSSSISTCVVHWSPNMV